MVENPEPRLTPADVIRDEIESRDWSFAGACRRLRWSPVTLERVLGGELAIDAARADSLEHAFGTGRASWLQLEKAYRAWRG